mmetsp:Transcript_15297/g.21294  ORF Transcript_15297/g.21294 Transcript_15297/m.21294 type:complete len:94 (+) Transcript_15297:103-384(+)
MSSKSSTTPRERRRKRKEEDIAELGGGRGTRVVPKRQDETSHDLVQHHVRFSGRLQVIEFCRAQAGSSGVPKSGGYSLGIGGDGKCVLVPFES